MAMPLHPNLAFLNHLPSFWDQSSEPHVMACGLRLCRNLEKFAFVPKLQPQSRAQILRFIASALKENPALESVVSLEARQAGGEDKELLLERFPFLEGVNQAFHDETFILDSSGRLLALINLREHLELHLVAPGEKLDELLTQITEIESYLARSVEFAFHQRFGFLTANPRLCGTGLLANVILHLPALVQTGQLELILKEHSHENIRVSGIQPDSFPADLVLLQNNQTLGLTEEKIIASLQSLVSRLVIAEASQCRHLQAFSPVELMDKVSRAFGLLRHSYLLSTLEAMQALSFIKLGIMLNWIQGIPLSHIHKLLMGSQRLYMKGERHFEPGQNMNHERALNLHEAMTMGNLTI
jgi:protein arginine kinase